MKNVTTMFSKSIAMVGLFSLILGSLLIPLTQVKAGENLPSVGISASPDTICSGETTQLRWDSVDATSVFIDQGIGYVDQTGRRDVTLTQSKLYTITGNNGTGIPATASVKVNVSTTGSCGPVNPTNPPTGTLTAETAGCGIAVGQNSCVVYFNWSTNNIPSGQTPSVTNSNNSTVGTGNSGSHKPFDIKFGGENFKLWSSLDNSNRVLLDTENVNAYCSSGTWDGNKCAGTVINPPSGVTVDLRADDDSIDSGDSTILRWTSTNASTCTASGGANNWAGVRPPSGTFPTGSLTSDKSYTITCYNTAGASAFASDTVRINVSDDNDDDISVDIKADDASVAYNDDTIVRWTSKDADSCRATRGTNGWSGSKNENGSFNTGRLTQDTTFTITCENRDGDEDDDSVTVRVSGNNLTCQDIGATNYRGVAPCVYNNTQPTVVVYADSTNIAYNGATNIRWSTTNANSCYASGGSTGWAGTKSIGPGSFYTGSLTSGRTYTLTCVNNSGSATDSITVNVRPRTVVTTTTRPAPSSLVLITSSVDRNQPIVPTLDNTRPHPGDEINYTVTYQNIGNAAITNLTLRIDLPYEVDYMYSNPNNPIRSGNTLIFNLGTLKANGEGTVTVRVRVRENIPAGTNLDFPALLTYTDPSGFPQSVNANVSAQVWSDPQAVTLQVPLGANAFWSGYFLPSNIFGWLLLIILILLLLLLARYLYGQFNRDRVVYVNTPPPQNH